MCHHHSMRARALAVALLAALAARVAHVVVRTGGAHWPARSASRLQRCVLVEGAPGAEDVAVDHRRGWAFLSAADHGPLRAARCGWAAPSAIYLLELANITGLDAPVRPLRLPVLGAPPGLHLHFVGISFLRTDQGEELLFAVNMGDAHDAVLSFELDAAARALECMDEAVAMRALRHFRAMYTGAEFVSTNDVAAVGPHSFFFTNDHAFRHPWLQAVEDFLGAPWSTVYFHDGVRAHLAARGLRYANGVATSADTRTVYVAATLDLALHVFDRPAAATAGDAPPPLTLRASVAVSSGPDNVVVGPDGTLWLAGHPNFLLWFYAHWASCAHAAPSEVLSVRPAGDAFAVTQHLLLVPEQPLATVPHLNGSATAAPLGPYLLVTPVFDARWLLCQR